MTHFIERKHTLSLILAACFLISFVAVKEVGAADAFEKLFTAEERTKAPTIEDLTNGKVKVGDLITKDNVDAVKEYLMESVYVCVKEDGMVLKMAENPAPKALMPSYFWKATVRSLSEGKPVMDENGTIYMKDGSFWTGGLPYPHPTTGLEVMANVKYGRGTDDFWTPQFGMMYVNKDGVNYKTIGLSVIRIECTGRLKVPPLGTIPGLEGEQQRSMPVFHSPLTVKGLGSFSVRYYDEYKDPDTGFTYLPAFKRIIRTSQTTYQDNMAGSDMTWGDPNGLREPFAYYDFKLLAKKPMLIPAFTGMEPSDIPFCTPAGKVSPRLTFDHGKSFVRLNWAIVPANVVECIPKIKHIYGKRVLCVLDPPYWAPAHTIMVSNLYDRQLKLWKMYLEMGGNLTSIDGEPFALSSGFMAHNVQTGHSTLNMFEEKVNTGKDARRLTLQSLLEAGR